MKTLTNLCSLSLLFFCIILNATNSNKQLLSSQCEDYNIYCGEVLNLNNSGFPNDLIYSDYGGCLSGSSSLFNAGDIIVRVNGTAGDILTLEMTGGVDLDMFLFDSCPGDGLGKGSKLFAECIDFSTNPYPNTDKITLPYDGVFYLVIDGYNSAQAGKCRLSMNCERPISCDGILALECGSVVTDWTWCGPYPPSGIIYLCEDLINKYDCSSKNYPAVHKEYTFVTPNNGTFEFNLTNLTDDNDLFLFRSYCDVYPSQLYCEKYSTKNGINAEKITIDLKKGEIIYLVVDGVNASPFTLSVNCTSKACFDCFDCFYYLPSDNDPSICRLYNTYCEKARDIATRGIQSEGYDYDWLVAGGTPIYQNNTSKTSVNPIMKFPVGGSYTICMKVYYTTNRGSRAIVYECCQTIIINQPCNSSPVAHFNYTFNSSDNSFTLNSNTSTNTTNVKWDFGDNYENGGNINFLQGTSNTSASPRVLLPLGYCRDICLAVNNACGISTYCVKLCRNNSGCSGNTPIYTLNNAVTPTINNKTVSFNSSFPQPAGTTAEFSWDFGDELGFSTARNPSYTYPKNGRYLICLVIKSGCKSICYCWTVWISPCTPVYEPHGGMLSSRFGGNESTLQYTITSSGVTIAPNQPWLVDRAPVDNSSGNANLTYSFPQDKDYEVCFPYIKSNGCLAYKCIIIKGGNPFNCSNISWKFIQNSGYQFSLPSGYTEIKWTLDETNQNLGNTTNSSFVLPKNPCGWQTISVIYFDGTRYIVCCLRIYLCAPDYCFDNIYVGNTDQNVQFRLNESGVSNISWYFDDAPNTILGSSNTIGVPYPSNCSSRWITAKFKDAQGRWRICCKLIWFCNPFACSSITSKYDESMNRYYFELDENITDAKWSLDNPDDDLGTGKISIFRPAGDDGICRLRHVSVRYKKGNIWYLCCTKIYYCNPSECENNVTIAPSGTNYKLTTNNNFQQITWFKDGVQLGTGNNLTTSITSSGRNIVCIRYYDPSDQSWRWCCKTFKPGGNANDIIFDIDDNVCGALGQTISIPVKVKNFTKVSSFQFSVNISDIAKGEIVGIEKANVVGDINFGLISPTTATVIWDNPSAIDLADNTAVINIIVKIKALFSGSADINITNSPTEINAEQNQQTVKPTVVKGSFCVAASNFKICGKITREDNVAVPNVTVTLSGGKTASATTNTNGEYCFENLNGSLNYSIKPSKNTNHINGVNTGDVTAIRRHILALEKLNSPYKLIAADASKTNAVNTGDVTEIRRLILALISQFSTTQSWAFVPKSHVFSNPTNPFAAAIPDIINVTNLNSNISDQNFIGIKIGDVNLSNNPSNLSDQIETRSATDINLIISSANVTKNQNFDINITVKQFKDITSGSFSVNWNANLFAYNSLKNLNTAINLTNDNFNPNFTSNGKLGFIWDSPTPVSLPDNALLFTISFKAKENGNESITITDDPVQKYFENKDQVGLNIIVTNGQILVPTSDFNEGKHLQFFPNPTTGFLSIAFNGTLPGTMSVINSAGQEYQIPIVQSKIDLSNFSSGVYILKGIIENTSFIEKIILIK